MGLLEVSEFHGRYPFFSSTDQFKPATSTVLTEVPSWICRRGRYCQEGPPNAGLIEIYALQIGR